LSDVREALESFLTVSKDPLRLSLLLQAPSGQILKAVRKLGLEGVVGKRFDSTYEPGERSGAWITESQPKRAHSEKGSSSCAASLERTATN
jgi:bifunctional non-homologous end joining protein LigD